MGGNTDRLEECTNRQVGPTHKQGGTIDRLGGHTDRQGWPTDRQQGTTYRLEGSLDRQGKTTDRGVVGMEVVRMLLVEGAVMMGTV